MPKIRLVDYPDGGNEKRLYVAIGTTENGAHWAGVSEESAKYAVSNMQSGYAARCTSYFNGTIRVYEITED